MIWKNPINLQVLNQISQNTMVTHLGIEFIDFGDDFLKAKMPVDQRTKQPMGLLHGGASAALAETLGSVASVGVVDDPMRQHVVGVEINANHLKAAKTGWVTGTVKPIKLGRRIHVWNIEIHNDEGQLCCVSRLTTMIIERS